jgi:hypothetical protein
VQRALIELTANLLRVTRGAGKAWAIGDQAVALVKAMAKFQEITGIWPTAELANEISSWDELPSYLTKDEDIEHHYAEQAALRGALQIVASRLL